jgi:glycine cleavage system H protein
MLLHLTGNVDINYLKQADEMVRKGEKLARIIHRGKKLDIISPITGKLSIMNPSLPQNPVALNQDPYGNGWICRITPAQWKSETRLYRVGEEAALWLKSELDRIKDYMATRAPQYSPDFAQVILQDGGELRMDLLSELPGEVWIDFEKEFLSLKDQGYN